MDSFEKDLAVQTLCLKHLYGKQIALNSISLEVHKSEIFGILGPNGGGKTTLFRILSTMLVPSEGEAKIFGKDCRKQANSVRSQIGVIFQSPSLDQKLTVFENLLHHGHLYGMRGKHLRSRIENFLEKFKLWERRFDLVEVLSGGLARRVEIVKGILHLPKLLILDEPSTGLDPGARRDLWNMFRELRDQEGMTILLTTHIMGEAEECDRIAILHQGQIVALDTPVALKSNIEGKVISVETKDPKKLAEQIENRFQTTPTMLNGTLRIQHTSGSQFLGKLMEAFPQEIEAITVRMPTLEDVFIHHTGQRFAGEEAHV